MKVKILTAMSGPTVTYKIGDVVEVDSAEGARLCAAGRAEPVKQKREKATITKKETADK